MSSPERCQVVRTMAKDVEVTPPVQQSLRPYGFQPTSRRPSLKEMPLQIFTPNLSPGFGLQPKRSVFTSHTHFSLGLTALAISQDLSVFILFLHLSLSIQPLWERQLQEKSQWLPLAMGLEEGTSSSLDDRKKKEVCPMELYVGEAEGHLA